MIAEARNRLKWNCTQCNSPSGHVGAALSLILEEKMLLGLSKPPKERVPVESLNENELVAQAIADRKVRAKEEKFKLTSTAPKKAWGEYTLTSKASGKTYQLLIRGFGPGTSYCSCPDFRNNTLGTCKHLIYAARRIKVKFTTAKIGKYKPNEFSLKLDFDHESSSNATGNAVRTMTLKLKPPQKLDESAGKIARKLLGNSATAVSQLEQCITKLEKAGDQVNIFRTPLS